MLADSRAAAKGTGRGPLGRLPSSPPDGWFTKVKEIPRGQPYPGVLIQQEAGNG